MKPPALAWLNRDRSLEGLGATATRSGRVPVPGDGAGDEDGGGLRDLLEWYAARDLAPDAVARGWAAMAASAVARPEEAAGSPSPVRGRADGAATNGLRRAWHYPRTRPRLAVALAAVTLLFAAALGVAVETAPGQPFYALRLDVEAIGLPPAQSSARLDADLARAEARLGEIVDAANEQDWNAVSAAAGAYGDLLASMPSAAGDTPGTDYRQRLENQLAGVEVVRAKAATAAVPALDRVIARLRTLLGQAPSQSPGRPDAGSPAPGANGSGESTAGPTNGSGNPGAGTPAPSPSCQGNNGNGNGQGKCNDNGNGNGGSSTEPAGTPTGSPTVAPTGSPSGTPAGSPAPSPSCQGNNGGGDGQGKCNDNGNGNDKATPTASPSPVAAARPTARGD